MTENEQESTKTEVPLPNMPVFIEDCVVCGGPKTYIRAKAGPMKGQLVDAGYTQAGGGLAFYICAKCVLLITESNKDALKDPDKLARNTIKVWLDQLEGRARGDGEGSD